MTNNNETMTNNNETMTMTPDENAAKFAPAATPDSYFIRNRETGKLELHFDKSDYDDLTDAQKREIKSAFLWGRRSGCWISRAKEPNLWHAEKIAKALDLADGGTTGERLSFAEQQERKAERAERRAERFEDKADAANVRGEALQKPISDMHGDIAFFTQPNINSSAGRAFTRKRERMFAAYESGFKEFNKSAYYRERAATARDTAAQKELNDKGFIGRRIAECETTLRKLKKNAEHYETLKQQIEQGKIIKRFDGEPLTLDTVNEWIESTLDRMEAQLDKLGYYQDAMDALGGVAFSRENIKPGYIVNVKHYGECRVVSTGPKNIAYQTGTSGIVLKAAYAEINSIVSTGEEPDAPQPVETPEPITVSQEEPAAPETAETPEPITVSLEEFAAYAAYLAACELPTQNEEGVHVGDIFSASWGYEQTNVSFYQVVELKGKHTAIIVEICKKEVRQTAPMAGEFRAVRDSFRRNAERLTVRTKKDNNWGVTVSIPMGGYREIAFRTDEFEEHEVSWHY